MSNLSNTAKDYKWIITWIFTLLSFILYIWVFYLYVCVPHACLVPMEKDVRVPELELVVT